MIRLGLTGSIGMGKSTIAGMFRDEGIPVWDADAAVHRAYAEHGALKVQLTEAFGDVVRDGRVDRARLSAALGGRSEAFHRLNKIVHPAIVEDRQRFEVHCLKRGDRLVILDIPLLFETGGETRVDKVLVVSAPPNVQRARVLARPGMIEARFLDILKHQTPDPEKRRRADFIIDTSQPLDVCRDQVRDLIRLLMG